MIAFVDPKGRALYRAMTIWQRFVLSTLWTVGLLVVAWLTWSALDRDLPVEVMSIEAAPVVVGAGQPVIITYNVLRRRICSSRGESVIVDAEGVRWPFDPTSWKVMSDKLGPDRVGSRFTVPQNAALGVARYRLVYYQACPFNPIHLLWPVVDVTDDVTFEIIRGPNPAP